MVDVIKEHRIDRSDWPKGPWDREAEDRIEWRSADGVPCLMVRSRMGAWCGYAAVGPDHPWHGKEYSHDDVSVDVHGGLTYADRCQAGGGPICHVPLPGEPDPVWWFGFDCLHLGDLYPGSYEYPTEVAIYRDREYVRREVERLAAQLHESRR